MTSPTIKSILTEAVEYAGYTPNISATREEYVCHRCNDLALTITSNSDHYIVSIFVGEDINGDKDDFKAVMRRYKTQSLFVDEIHSRICHLQSELATL